MKVRRLCTALLLLLSACKETTTSPVQNPINKFDKSKECRYINDKNEILNAKNEDLETMFEEVYKVPLSCKYLDDFSISNILDSESSSDDAKKTSEQLFLGSETDSRVSYDNNIRTAFENDYIYINSLDYTYEFYDGHQTPYTRTSICYKEDKVHYVNYWNQQQNTFEIKDLDSMKHIMDIYVCARNSQMSGNKFLYSEIEEKNDSFIYTNYIICCVLGDWDMHDEYYIFTNKGTILKDGGVVDYKDGYDDKEVILSIDSYNR